MGAGPVDAAVPALTGNDGVDEAGLAKQALCEPLEAIGRCAEQDIEQLVLPVPHAILLLGLLRGLLPAPLAAAPARLARVVGVQFDQLVFAGISARLSGRPDAPGAV